MPNTQEFNIALSPDLAAFVQQKVKNGEYASIDDVINNGLESLRNQDTVLQRWLHEVVVPAHDEIIRNPASAIPIDQMMPRLQARLSLEKNKNNEN